MSSKVLARGEEETRKALIASPLSADILQHVMIRCSSESLHVFQMASRWFFNLTRSRYFREEYEALSSRRRLSVHMLFSIWTASSQTFYSVPIEPTRAADASTRAINLTRFDLTRNFTGESVHQVEAYTDHYRGQSARGLILFSRTFKWNSYQDHVTLFYPASKASLVIPTTHPQHASYSNISSTTYCLGYSPHGDVYKVLAFNWNGYQGCTFKIMTVRERDQWTVNEKNWREIKVENLPLIMESQVYVQEDLCVQHKGSIRWLNHSTKLILSFDVEKELFFPTPARIPSAESCGRLLNLGGRLALIGFTTETVLWTSDDDLAQDWNQETIKMEDDEVIDPLSNPISDRFLTWWPAANATVMEILRVHFYSRANKRTTSQNVRVSKREWVDELGLFTTYEDIWLPIP